MRLRPGHILWGLRCHRGDDFAIYCEWDGIPLNGFLNFFYYSWFTTFCQFLLYSKMTQSYIYIHSLYKWLDTVSWAIQQDLIAYPLQMQQFASNPKLPVHPTPFPFPLAFSMSMSLFLSYRLIHLCHILDSTYKSYHMVFSLSDLLNLVWESLVPSMLLQMALSSSFYGSVVFHCVYALHLLNPFTCRWTFRLFPCLGYCE